MRRRCRRKWSLWEARKEIWIKMWRAWMSLIFNYRVFKNEMLTIDYNVYFVVFKAGNPSLYWQYDNCQATTNPETLVFWIFVCSDALMMDVNLTSRRGYWCLIVVPPIPKCIQKPSKMSPKTIQKPKCLQNVTKMSPKTVQNQNVSKKYANFFPKTIQKVS